MLSLGLFRAIPMRFVRGRLIGRRKPRCCLGPRSVSAMNAENASSDAAGLFRLSLEGLACLVRHSCGDLGDPAGALNGLLETVSHAVALAHHEVRDGLASCEHAEIIELLLHALLRRAESSLREAVSPSRPLGAG